MRTSKQGLISIAVLFFMFALIPNNVLASDTSDTKSANEVSIEKVLEMAYKNNPDLRKASLDVEKAQIIRDDSADYIDYIPAGGLVYPQMQQLVNGFQQAEIGLTTAKKAEKVSKDKLTTDVITAYSQVVKDYNNVQLMKTKLTITQDQNRIMGVAWGTGVISSYDTRKGDMGLKQMNEAYKASELAYQASIAKLRALLGQSSTWEPVLTSKSILDTYPRNELNIEISRGLSEAAPVWTKEALLDIEKSKENWILPNVSSDMQKITLNTAEIDYEQAKRTARATIESLYYAIDALEGQIKTAELDYENAKLELDVAELKYDLGMLPRYAMKPGSENLIEVQSSVNEKELKLDNLRADLVKTKAEFALMTGQTVYDDKDWIQ